MRRRLGRPLPLAGWLALGPLAVGICCNLTSETGASFCAEALGDAGAFVSDGGPADGGLSEAGLDGAASCPVCPTVATCGGVADPAVVAVAGVAASARHPRAYYLHNGPLDSARFFAVAETGGDLGTYQVSGAANVDWEDLAVGPCPGGFCVFLADIGDRAEVRGQYTIYRVPEPTELSAGVTTVTADAFPFAYPDGSHDAAAILVHPTSRVVTVITRDRSGGGTFAYDLPTAQPGQPVTATPRGPLDRVGLGVAVTAASGRADGAILLRTTKGALLFPPPPADAGPVPPAAAVLAGVPCAVPVPKETDGEAIAWTPLGNAYLALDQGPAPRMDFVLCPGL
jgi:hypothetical protein